MRRTKAYEVAAAMLMSVSLLKRRIRDSVDDAALTSPELRVLSRLDRAGPATTADLARQEQITPQAMGSTVALLEKRGFVARSPDPRHGRRMLLAPTREGEEALRSGSSAIADRFTDALLAAFDDDEIEVLRAAAPLIERWAERM
ncbi:MarR family transcriptional regulator [Streptomyces sp. SID3212]|uniref:MarR family winged helix-turn-helix transcriptional regulator n=1 Tax=Streptomyces sp. SID3212 TaxID=2690259 RepID=UPI00136DD5FB|nr:MarR family transcriptional regulator [Streptomyces sp. SID3212]MYV56863.1 MarR family transcriptional regulator [Streptomyces sp. SID3212]